MPIYMNWGNTTPPTIQGTVTETTHLHWIELTSVQYSSQRGDSVKNRPASPPPKITEIVLSRSADSASSELFRESINGKGADVVIHFAKLDVGHNVVYLVFKLAGTIISNYSISGSGQRSPSTESLTLNFEEIAWGSTPDVTPHTGP
jgi:type VI secretion system secreted protein Hcp